MLYFFLFLSNLRINPLIGHNFSCAELQKEAGATPFQNHRNVSEISHRSFPYWKSLPQIRGKIFRGRNYLP